VIRRREGGFCHDAPPGLGENVTGSQSPIAAERRRGDAGPMPQATSCSLN
jgi:hypothetical protein